MITISSRSDIETYIDNDHPDFTGNDRAALIAAIQSADHPDYGRDWADWLNANVATLRAAALA